MKAVILAGGLGKRLKPLTQVIPKPLMPIGERPILEIQISRLKEFGFDEIFIATYYMADYIMAFMGNGEKYGVRLRFSQEEKPLGTVGPVLLLKECLDEPFILMNGDILTSLNFSRLYNFALSTNSDLTVVTRELVTPFNFGKVISDGDYIVEIEEKPDFVNEIVTGIYVLKPDIFDLIPEGQYFGIDDLIKKMFSENKKVAKYLMDDYWIDIGQIDDFEKAQNTYTDFMVSINGSNGNGYHGNGKNGNGHNGNGYHG